MESTHTDLRRHRARLVFVTGLIAAVALLTASVGTPAASRPAPKLVNPTATAKPLVTHYFTLLKNQDVKGLQRFLAPGFQLQRADGSADGKSAYLTNLPTIDRFFLAKVVGTQAYGTLVVRYQSRVEGTANGKPYMPGFSPRLSTFSWSGTGWRLSSHANFNPLVG